MVLIDTSVLIPFFRGIENESVKKMESLIKNQIPFGINKYIYLEILQGVSNINSFNQLKTYLFDLEFYDIMNGIHSIEEAALKYYNCRREGITIRSTIDMIIAQTAIENNLMLLHDDKDFFQISKVYPELMFI